MLDCPEHSQTSPTSRSCRVTMFDPVTVSVPGDVLAGNAGNSTDQRPVSPVRVLAVFPPKSTFTASPGAAQPQIRSGLSRCNTA